jgi:hypothetical protein
MTSKEIRLKQQSEADWMKEIAYQLALANEREAGKNQRPYLAQYGNPLVRYQSSEPIKKD